MNAKDINLPPWFFRFLDKDADRSNILETVLKEAGISANTVILGEGKFVFAWPKNIKLDKKCRLKIITAHHDRVANTQGALDNSAACLQLVRFLQESLPCHNTLVVFTDKEERDANITELGTEQGSYLLGMALPSMGLADALVFPLDVTGRGDTIILSTSVDAFDKEAVTNEYGVNHRSYKSIANNNYLIKQTSIMSDIILQLMIGQCLIHRLPFGEDLGFLRSGIPALLVSILPRAEAVAMVNNKLPPWASLNKLGTEMPLTWQYLHTENDTIKLYAPKAFFLMSKFLYKLSMLRIPSVQNILA